MYERKDTYYQKAKKEGYRARSSYKLLELQRKYQFLQRKSRVLDLGCAPGSWLQVVKQFTTEGIVGVDLIAIKPMERVMFVQSDILDERFLEKLHGTFDVVLADVAPRTSGQKERDQYLSYELPKQAFLIALKVLNKNGCFVVKTFQSSDTEELVEEIKKRFPFVKRYVPKSTRQGSKEMYIVALRLR